jgi:hypothetical protein
MNAPTVADALTVDEIIDAMQEVGGWYLRKRKRALVTLWRHKSPATARLVEAWVQERFPLIATANILGVSGMRRLAEAAICELRYHDHGLQTLTDETASLI